MSLNLDRRRFLRLMGSAVAGTFLSGAAGRSQSRRRPNFILIFADDLGYGDISGFGFKKSPYETPHLERMAAEGARLTSFYVPTPYCAPSRGTILTGRYPFRHGVVFNPCPDAGINDVGLPASERTIAALLRDAGYATSCIGKWHLGHVPQYLPRRRGFDEYLGILYSNDMRDFVERCHRLDRPFFLYLPHAMPHKPLAVPAARDAPQTAGGLRGLLHARDAGRSVCRRHPRAGLVGGPDSREGQGSRHR